MERGACASFFSALKLSAMQATFKNPQNNINAKAHRKEDKLDREFAAIVPAPEKWRRNPVTLRTYRTGSTAYACLWVNGETIYCSGSGKAGGYGYHKASAAAQVAINSAGIELSKSIDGVGDEAIEEAVKAIAVAMGYEEGEIYVHVAHG